MTKDRAYWLAWSSIPGIGPVSLKRISNHFHSLETAWHSSDREFFAVEGFGMKSIGIIKEYRPTIDPGKLLEEHSLKNPHFLTPADPDYPRLLLEIPCPPPILYYRGRIDREERPAIAIVGTRQPTDHGKRWARKLAKTLAARGFTIVSGLAAGIDGEAHRGCLEVGGRTVAVVGTGVDLVYPSHHRQLHGEIAERGLILSEYPDGTGADKSHFPARNRIIAALCRGTIVIEAPEKSGSLITARYANDFGRDVYTLPTSPDIKEGRGCLQLIRQGAEIVLSEDDLLERLGELPTLDPPPPSPTEPALQLEPRLDSIYKLFDREPESLDRLVRDSARDTAEVAGILLELELMGLVSTLPGSRYRKINR